MIFTSFLLSTLYFYLSLCTTTLNGQGTITDGNYAANAEWGASWGNTYDFIVVGAGAAGPIVAAKLSATNNWTVLLLEAGGKSHAALGGDDYVATAFKQDPVTGVVKRHGHYTRIDVPAFTASILDPVVYDEYNWNITNAETGKTLGGSQAHNAMFWGHPTPYDLYRWNVTGWSYSQFIPYIQQVENFTNSGFPVNPATQGYSGPVQIRRPALIGPVDTAFVNACVAAGIPFNPAFGPAVGVNYYAQNIGFDGVRQTNALTQLAPLLLSTKPLLTNNTLTIAIHSEVTRVLFANGTNGGLPTATGIQFIVTIGGRKYKQTAFARKEVIISAGGLLTPKLLILSGIGPSKQLAAFGIPPVVINENVGQNIRNHLLYYMEYSGPNVTWPNMNDLGESEIYYGLTGNGVYATAAEIGAAFAYIKTIPSLADPDILILLATATASPYAKGIEVGIVTSQPDYDFGTVTLASADPTAPPNFNPNFANVSQYDVNAIVAGIREVRQIFAQPVAEQAFGVETFPGPSVNTSAQLDASVRENIGIAYHYYGSAKMGNPGDPLRVVDNTLLVVGTSNLRVIDSSIAPNRVNFVLQAVVSGIAEKGVAMIIAKWA